MGEVVARASGAPRRMRDLWARGCHRRTRCQHHRLSTIRGGDIVGDHTVLFGLGERIEITHKSGSRILRWDRCARRDSSRRQAGLFDMQDVLGLLASPARPRALKRRLPGSRCACSCSSGRSHWRDFERRFFLPLFEISPPRSARRRHPRQTALASSLTAGAVRRTHAPFRPDLVLCPGRAAPLSVRPERRCGPWRPW